MKIFSALLFAFGAILFITSAGMMTGVPGVFFATGLTIMLAAVIGACEK